MKPYHLMQIDLLKGGAILSIIAIHAIASLTFLGFPWLEGKLFGNWWLHQAVPIFVIIMGLNMGASFARKRYGTLYAIFAGSYLIDRFWRIVFPLAEVSLFSVFVGVVLTGVTGQNQLYFGPRVLIGFLPLSKIAIGNYFVAFILEFIFIFPIIYRVYRSYPRLTIISCFLGDLLYELIAPTIMGDNLYNVLIFRLLFAVALGLWLSDDHDLFARRNRFILAGAVVSVAYLLGSDLAGHDLISYFSLSWYTQNAIAYFYPALLILVGIKFLPKASTSHVVQGLATLGKASYHIFLVQLLYYLVSVYFVLTWLGAYAPNVLLASSLLLMIGGFFICCSAGLLFMSVDGKLQVLCKEWIQRSARKRDDHA